MLHISVDDHEIAVAENTNLLAACLANGIYIPNLCYIEGAEHAAASCRLCFVEVAGMDRPVTACTVLVREGMRVRTDTGDVRRLQRSALRLLLSVHHIDCRNCPANKRCELQKMARFLGMRLNAKPLETVLTSCELDASHAFIDYYPNRCVLCGRCIAACRDQNDQPLLAFAKRGFDTIISSFGHDATSDVCLGCDACVAICPVTAIIAKR